MTYIISRFCRIAAHETQTETLRITTNSETFILKNEFSDLYRSASMEYPKFFKMDSISKCGILASEYLLKGIDIKGKYSDTEIGIVLSNATGSLDTDLEFQKTINNKTSFFPSPAIFVYTLSNIVMGEICIKHKIKGENMFFLSETFPSDLLQEYVADLFQTNKVQSAIVGWVEYSTGKPDVLLLFVEKTETLTTELEFTSSQIASLYAL
ncbi:hypothetical protein [uncultured Cytophaga sp.]|uniref:hypothetical protein n=1 Tax=uncultured Cytophaga sp. TaxID=160238 RepID=UPI00263516B0|nr:hypothetical protein [uncultured Cytophaga sp.]